MGTVHVTSSPYYPQSNGQAERAVQTAKSFVAKSPDINEALLAHRTTPGSTGYSPAELLMGRRLQAHVPVPESSLQPLWPYLRQHRARHNRDQQIRASYYNRRHRASSRRPLRSRTAVRILAGAAAHGTIIGQASTPRSYVVATSAGVTRRTSRHLQEQRPPPPQLPKPPRRPPSSVQNRGAVTTRSGRLVRPPERLGYQ